ncbi:hypothetical protein QQP08_014811 [Theobroma cacao]|nr:hypothetical protein QQP08_014811 [Theobroma cacao]
MKVVYGGVLRYRNVASMWLGVAKDIDAEFVAESYDTWDSLGLHALEPLDGRKRVRKVVLAAAAAAAAALYLRVSTQAIHMQQSGPDGKLNVVRRFKMDLFSVKWRDEEAARVAWEFTGCSFCVSRFIVRGCKWETSVDALVVGWKSSAAILCPFPCSVHTIESSKKRASKKLESFRKSVTAAYSVERNKTQTLKYLLRSMSKENKKPPVAVNNQSFVISTERKPGANRVKRV